MMTETSLFEQVTNWMEIQQRKHGLGDDYVENTVNDMTNFELLRAISDALEEMEAPK